MKIKIGSSWFEPTTEAPIMVVMTPKEKSDIANMAPDATMYAVFTDDCAMSSDDKLAWMTEPAKEKSPAFKEQLLSCVCLLETMAEWAAKEGHEVEHVMMSVMAKNGREVLDAA